MDTTNQNENMPLLGRFNQVLLSPFLARGLLAVAILEALAAPFLGIRWALCAIATGIASLGVTSQLSSIALSWVWQYLRALQNQAGQRDTVPGKSLSVN